MKPGFLLLGTLVLNVIGQVVMKRGMTVVGTVPGDLASLPAFALRTLTTPFVWLGFAAYGLSAALWLVVLSRLELSFAYPILSLSYVLIVLISALVLHENVTPVRWLGVLVIIGGVWLISQS